MQNKNYSKIKRILDILLSIILLILLSPCLIIISIKIKLENDGPILFKQERLGKNGKTITIYKFRTMHVNNNLFNFNEKDQVTKFGKHLRKLGLDETPQLFNILKGEMSLIGPRATVTKYNEYYTPEQKRRLDVLPGLLGPTNCVTKDTSILEKIKLDIDYVENYSIKEDLKIIYTFLSNYNNIISHRIKGSKGNKQTIEKELKTLKENLTIYEKTMNNVKSNETNNKKNINITQVNQLYYNKNINHNLNQEIDINPSIAKRQVLKKTLTRKK